MKKSACYLSAIKLIAIKRKITLPADVAIDTEVDLGLSHGFFTLAARININLPGMDHDTAQALVDSAHAVCPYSRATHGNIEVVTNVVTERVQHA